MLLQLNSFLDLTRAKQYSTSTFLSSKLFYKLLSFLPMLLLLI
jgi:hypothetical protein